MKHNFKQRLLALALVACTFLGLGFPAQAASIADGSKTCSVALAPVHNYLTTTAGTSLRAAGYNYTTNDGLTGAAYCIDHGLAYTGKTLPITGKYTASPATAGAFANGYPQHSLETFLGLYLEDNPILSGLTEDEYRYATQVAIWATLGQLAIDGTPYTSGRERLAYPTGDTQQMRVFVAAQLICKVAKTWDRVYQSGMYIRLDEYKLGGNVEIPPDMTLEYAAEVEQYGIKREVINGKAYFTKEYIFASATSTYYQDYTMDLWATGCPAGTIFTDLSNNELPRSKWHETDTWRIKTEYHGTSLNYNGSEFWTKAKICIPVETAPNKGEIILHCAAQIMQYDIYLANNTENSQQSYIIADPSKGTKEAEAVLSWGSEMTELGTLEVLKVGGGGLPLAGAVFSLDGTDGSHRTGTTDDKGVIRWEKLDPDVTYTLTETDPPAGYSVVDPMTVKVKAARIEYVTVRDDPQHTLTVHKIDRQTGYSLRGAVICFEQIDGDFKTSGTTDHAGNIQLNADQLPIGSYKVYEITAPEGYITDKTPQTVHWDGKRDVTLTFDNVRQPTLIISKKDARTNYNLPEATFEVYRDGQLVTTVTTNEAGLAYVPGVSSGHYEVKEIAAPEGYALNGELVGVNIDPYDPATTDDPRLVVTNEPLPGLRILKYDRASMKPLTDVTFKVYRDAALVGSFTTNRDGEILLTGLEPGTYIVEEVAAPDSHVVNSTPQSIELTTGQADPATLIFFDDLKPGMRLVKVDSVTMNPLPNATYLISKVGGAFSKEFTTDGEGEIDLSKLEPGAYQVKEVKAPDGYLIDDGIRIIQLNAGENAQFVFTDTPKPSLTVVKYDPQNNKYLAGATFRIAAVADGSHYLDRVTDTQGRITITDLEPGVYSIQETAAPAGYVLNPTEYHVELFPGKGSELVVVNEAKPDLQIVKTDAITGQPVAGVTFTVKLADGRTITTEATDSKGEIFLSGMEPGVVEIWEQSVPSGYLLNEEHQLITLVPNKLATVRFQNYPRPALEVLKTDTSGNPIPDVVFTLTRKDNTPVGDFSTGEDGIIRVYDLDATYYILTEKSVPTPYILDSTPHEVLLVEGKTTSVTIQNKRNPNLTISKVDSITGDPVAGAKFTVWYAVNGSLSGEIREVGKYTSGADGTVTLKTLEPGWYRVTETEPPAGYDLKEPSTLEIFMEADQDRTITFENTPLNALIIKKVDATDGHVLQGAKFRVRYFEGVTGTGGTTIGEYETSANGTIVITGLKAGTYIVEETQAPAGYIVDDAPKTVYISKSQAAVTVEFANQPDSGLTITKLDSVTKNPLAGATFEVRNSSGAVVGNANGQYTTDESGTIYLPGLATDTYVVKEIKAPSGYVLDSEAQTIKLAYGETHSLTFYNEPQGALVITKLDSETRKPLSGATFKITTSSGAFVAAQGGSVSSNGLYVTDKNGQIILTGLEPDTYVVTETKAPSGYELDSTPQTVKVNTHDTQSLFFYNTTIPEGGLRIVKLDEATRQPISGVEFSVTHMDGKRVGTYRTNSKGIISLTDLTPGWYTVTETKAAEGYALDAQPRDIEVVDGETATLEVTNRLTGSALIHKIDSVTGEGIYGVTFLVSDAKGNPVGQYTSDDRGYVYIDGELADGKYTVREIQAAEGYILDTVPKTIYIEYGSCSTVTWKNTPSQGQIQIVKKSADYNSINGLPAGTLLEGAVFEVYNERTGNKVDTITTGANGLAVSKTLPLGRYIIREVKAPANYTINSADITAVLEYSGQIVRFEVTNKSVNIGVGITKSGPKEVVSGQPVRYVFSGISNTSNVTLDSYYWRDTLPAAVTLDKVMTGTYNFPGTYKVIYKVNNTGDYRTLADNLSTAKTYTLTATPAALGLAANERITEVMFVFGQVPGGFAQVEAPMLYCTAAKGLGTDSSFTNTADAGGVYNGQWIQAVSRWVTTVYGNPTPLPRTGY